MNFTEEIKSKSDSDLSHLLNIKIHHLDERFDTPPETIIQHVVLLSYNKIHLFRDISIEKTLYKWLRTSCIGAYSKRSKEKLTITNCLSIVAAHIIYEMYKDTKVWPIELLALYLDDALGCRLWVDSPDVAEFCRNLLEWTKSCTVNVYNEDQLPVSTVQVLDERSCSHVEEDSSAGEEEVLAEGSDQNPAAPIPTVPTIASRRELVTSPVPIVLDRYCGIHKSAASMVYEVLHYCITGENPPTHGVIPTVGVRSQIIVTIRTFCSLPTVRLLAAQNLVHWLSNPAMVEHVGHLLESMSACLQTAIVPSVSGLLASDHKVIEALIGVRSSLKLSLAEVHRKLLISVIKRGTVVARLVTRLHLLENQTKRGSASDSIKLLIQILSSLHDTSEINVPSHECPYTQFDNQSIGKRYEYVSLILGQAVRHIISFDIYIQSLDLKTLHEDVIRVFSALGVRSLCPSLFFAALLWNTDDVTSELKEEPEDELLDVDMPSLSVVNVISDIALSIQLLYASTIVQMDRKPEEMPVASNISTGSNTGGGRGIPGRTAGRTGRGGGITGQSSAFLRSSSKPAGVSSASLRGGRSGGRNTNSRSAVTTQTSNDPNASGDSSLDTASRKRVKDECFIHCTRVQEACLRWFVVYVKSFIRSLRSSNSVDSNQPPLGRQLSSSPRNTEGSVSDTSSKPYVPALIDCLQQVIGVNVKTKTKINVELDKVAHLVTRDNCVVTSKSLVLLIDCVVLISVLDSALYILDSQRRTNSGSLSSPLSSYKKSEVSFMGTYATNLTAASALNQDKMLGTYDGVSFLCSGVDLIEHFVNKALRTVYKDSTGFLADDISIITKLFGLCRVRVFDENDIAAVSKLPNLDPLSGMLGNQSENASASRDTLDILECVGLCEVYWRVCVACYIIGCASPKVLGEFLWHNIPTVQSLMLMSMSERFFYPPSIADAESMIALVNGAENGKDTMQVSAPFDVELGAIAEADKTVDIRHLEEKCSQIRRHMRTVQNIYIADEVIKREEMALWDKVFKPRVRNLGKSSTVAKDFVNPDASGKRSRDSEDDSTHISKKLKAETSASGNTVTDVAEDSGAEAQKKESRSIVKPVVHADTVRRSSRRRVQRFSYKDMFGGDSEGSSSSDEDSRRIVRKRLRGVRKVALASTPLQEYDYYVTRWGVPSQKDVLLLPLQSVSRVPPDDVIRRVKQIDLKNKFGTRLRECRDPDFIAAVAGGLQNNGQNSQNCSDSHIRISGREDILEAVGWLVPAIAANVASTLARIPISAALHILLVIIGSMRRRLLPYGFEIESILPRLILNDSEDVISTILNSIDCPSTHVLTQYRSAIRDLLTSKSQQQDILLSAAILKKLSCLVTESLPLSDCDINNISQFFFECVDKPSAVDSSMVNTSVFVIGTLFGEMCHTDVERRSVARIALTSISSLLRCEGSAVTPPNLYMEFFVLVSSGDGNSDMRRMSFLFEAVLKSIVEVETSFHTLCMIVEYISNNSRVFEAGTYETIGSKIVRVLSQTPMISAAHILSAPERNSIVNLVSHLLQCIEQFCSFGNVLLTDMPEDLSRSDMDLFIAHGVGKLYISVHASRLLGSVFASVIRNAKEGDVHGTLSDMLSDWTGPVCLSVCHQVFMTAVDSARLNVYGTFFRDVVRHMGRCEVGLLCTDIVQLLPISVVIDTVSYLLKEVSLVFVVCLLSRLETDMCSKVRDFLASDLDQELLRYIHMTVDDIESMVPLKCANGWATLKSCTKDRCAEWDVLCTEPVDMGIPSFVPLRSHEGDSTNNVRNISGGRICEDTLNEFIANSLEFNALSASAAVYKSIREGGAADDPTKRLNCFEELLPCLLVECILSSATNDVILFATDTIISCVNNGLDCSVSDSCIALCCAAASLPGSIFDATDDTVSLDSVRKMCLASFRCIQQVVNCSSLADMIVCWRKLWCLFCDDCEKDDMFLLHYFPMLQHLLHCIVEGMCTLAETVCLEVLLHSKCSGECNMSISRSFFSEVACFLRHFDAIDIDVFSETNIISTWCLENVDGSDTYDRRTLDSAKKLFMRPDFEGVASDRGNSSLMQLLCKIVSRDVSFAVKWSTAVVPQLLDFPWDSTKEQERQLSPDIAASIFAPELRGLKNLRVALYVAYASFPEEVLFAVRKWAASRPPLPQAWVYEVKKQFTKRNQSKRKRSSKSHTSLNDVVQLDDGRLWQDSITHDILMLFQLLLVEEGRMHMVGAIYPHDTESKQSVHNMTKVNSDSSSLFRDCVFDSTALTALEILKDSKHITPVPKNRCSPQSDSDMVSMDSSELHMEEDETSMSEVDRLQERAGILLCDIAAAHPALFMRYHKAILHYISKRAVPPVHAIPGNKKGISESSESREEGACLTLPAVVPGRDSSHTTHLAFTARGAVLNPVLWEVVISCYEACNPAIVFLHGATKEYGMDETLEAMVDTADRRVAFDGLMQIYPSLNSDFDDKLNYCTQALSESEITTRIRKEKKLARIEKVLSVSAKMLTGLYS